MITLKPFESESQKGAFWFQKLFLGQLALITKVITRLENKTCKMDRAALGRTASLGFLYDARQDRFTGISIFKDSIPRGCITEMDNPHSDIHVVKKDDYTEKFSNLSVTAELQASVLAGLVSLQGSGKYLTNQKKSAKTLEANLVYNIKTKTESLIIYHKDLKDLISLDALQDETATHFVAEICWGANCVLTCQCTSIEDGDQKQIKGHLDATMAGIEKSLKANADADYQSNDNLAQENFEIRIFGDVVPCNNEPLPTKIEKAKEFMTNFPKLVQSSNEGKGKPILYKLVSVTVLKKYLKVMSSVSTVLKELDESSLLRVVQLFDEINSVKQKVNDFSNEVNTFPACVSRDKREEVNSWKREFEVWETGLRKELSGVLVKLRSGNCEVEEMEGFIGNSRRGKYSPGEIETQLEKWKDIQKKINYVKRIESYGGKYVGVDCDLDDELDNISSIKSYVFYWTSDKQKETKIWAKNKNIFFQKMKERIRDFTYFVVDCEFHSATDSDHYAQVYEGGDFKYVDLIEETNPTKKFSFAKPIRGTIQVQMTNRVPFILPCTCNPLQEHNWLCVRCESMFEWGFDGCVYCPCGKTPASSLAFRCTNESHDNFEKHDIAHMGELLSEIKPFEEINILLMGEIGVGKSTFINAFQNFLQFGTFEEAVAHMDEDFNKFVGNNSEDNEIRKDGYSTTQSARIYQFQVGRTTIRLVDTPGFGDSRGFAQDYIHLESSLCTIKDLNVIHGICIFLKPNHDTRSSCCILTRLHKDACQNIVFCFTNSTNTFYQPEKTLSPLKDLLNGHKGTNLKLSMETVYYFDNEPFHFLARLNNKPQLSLDEITKTTHSATWRRSQETTKRLFGHILRVPGHQVKSTLSLNAAAEIILEVKSANNKLISKSITDLFQPFGNMSKKQRYDFLEPKIIKDLSKKLSKLAGFVKSNTILTKKANFGFYEGNEYFTEMIENKAKNSASEIQKLMDSYLLSFSERNIMKEYSSDFQISLDEIHQIVESMKSVSGFIYEEKLNPNLERVENMYLLDKKNNTIENENNMGNRSWFYSKKLGKVARQGGTILKIDGSLSDWITTKDRENSELND